jgi:hypothetical protein
MNITRVSLSNFFGRSERFIHHYLGRRFLYLILLFAAFVTRFRLSMTNGRSGAEPSYDDIVYLLDAKDRLNSHADQGFMSDLYSWIENPPHSPTSTIIAYFSQFFVHDSSSLVYFINGILITFMIFLIIRAIVPSVDNSILVTAIVVASPASSMLMFNFRPDPLYALTLTLLVIQTTKLNARKSLSNLIAFSSLLIIVKPSFFIFTGINVLLLLALNLRRYLELKGKSDLKPIIKSVFLSLIVSGWYLINGLEEIVEYVKSNTTGRTKLLWTEDGISKALEINFRAIALQIGPSFSAILLLLCLAMIAVSWRIFLKNPTSKALLYIGAINLCISAYSQISNPFFYLTSFLPWFFMCVILGTENAINHLKARNIQTTFLSISLFLLMLFQPSTEWAAKEIRAEGPVNSQFAKFLSATDKKNVVFMFAGGLNSDTTSWFLPDLSNKVKFQNLGLVIFNEKDAKKILLELKLHSLTIATRESDQIGFPSDSVQSEINQFITTNSNFAAAVQTKIGNYRVWSFK